MPRQNRVERRPAGRVAVVIDSIEHTLSEPAFIALMEAALNVMQALCAERNRPASASRLAQQLARHRAADPHCTCNDCVAVHFSGAVRNGK
jgi:hypothetical protein